MAQLYKLKKDLPTFNKGDRFELRTDGSLYLVDEDHKPDSPHWKAEVMAYHRRTLEQFPTILTDWFEEMPERKAWRPERGEAFYHLDIFNDVCLSMWNGCDMDCDWLSVGNCFPSRAEARKALKWLEAFKTLRDDAKGFKPKWLVNNYNNKMLREMKGGLKECFVVVWREGRIEMNSALGYTGSIIYFETAEAAERSIEKHEKEWLTFFGVEERSENA